MELKKLDKENLLQNCFRSNLNDTERNAVLQFFEQPLSFDSEEIINRITENFKSEKWNEKVLEVIFQALGESLEYTRRILVLQ